MLWESGFKERDTTVLQQLGDRGERWEESGPEGTELDEGGFHFLVVLSDLFC